MSGKQPDTTSGIKVLEELYYPHARCDNCNCPLTERSGSNSYGEFSHTATEKIVTYCDPNQMVSEPGIW